MDLELFKAKEGKCFKGNIRIIKDMGLELSILLMVIDTKVVT